ncbi:unnamed protein product, partial [Didymodactylos carnosus]
AYTYKRSIRTLKTIFIYLMVSQLEAFVEHNNEYKGKLTFIVNKFNNNMTNVTDYVIELLKKTDLLACFDKWRKENASKNLNFAYWDMIIQEY